ncbi:hypothetical protein VZC37_15410 [Gordonia sp. LSe1-13]|uniref:Uncharacterized protein n=1 Tax=Gordonia sesuvii TaxID=3116777 RepID=A0ABU7MF47_9ACTN|nr:hypothetical protein [Gordonia sp. LSe1-13]
MTYIDTSAMIKLLVRENESDALIAWFGERVASPSPGAEGDA